MVHAWVHMSEHIATSHCILAPLAGADDVRSMSRVLPYTQDQLRFCQALPKIELHAHLNGSIRDSTIRYVTAHSPCSLPPSLHVRTMKFDKAN